MHISYLQSHRARFYFRLWCHFSIICCHYHDSCHHEVFREFRETLFFFLNCKHDEMGYSVYPDFLNKYKIPALSAPLMKRQFKCQFYTPMLLSWQRSLLSWFGCLLRRFPDCRRSSRYLWQGGDLGTEPKHPGGMTPCQEELIKIRKCLGDNLGFSAQSFAITTLTVISDLKGGQFSQYSQIVSNTSFLSSNWF